MSLLQDEIDWILANQHRYEGPMHARAVIGNIEKRYKLTAAHKAVQKWADAPTTGNGFVIQDLFGVTPSWWYQPTNGRKK